MKIYAITENYETPSAYYVSKAAAEWAIANKPQFDSQFNYVVEIEVVE